MNDIYFHEDDFCQQELLPLDAMAFCRQQIEDIDAFSSEHATSDGCGWTDIFLRDAPQRKLSDLQIPLQTLRLILQKHLPEIAVVYTGYSSYRELCECTVAFGHDDTCVIYADWDNQEVIQHIWTGLFTANPQQLNDAVAALQELGGKYPLLYVDWAWNFVSVLDDSERLQNRLEKKISAVAEKRKALYEDLNLSDD